jgi:predicted GIY-YIG superfamily endonuclease
VDGDGVSEYEPPIIKCLRDGPWLEFFCRYCQKNHLHGICCKQSTTCKVTARGIEHCGCPVGVGDGHRWAHCVREDSPYQFGGYILREVACESGFLYGESAKASDAAEAAALQVAPRAAWRLPDAPIANRQHALYRFFGVSGELLYVGLTADPGRRFKQHRVSKEWWLSVANVTIEWFPDQAAVRRAETLAIRDENPIHNLQRRPLVR